MQGAGKWKDSRFGDVANGNYAEFEADGTLKLNGDASVWRARLVPAIPFGLGAGAPDRIKLAASNIEVLAFDGSALTEEISGSLEIPHDYKEGTDLHPLVIWGPTTNGAGNVKWHGEFIVSSIGSIDSGSTSISVVNATNTAAWENFKADFPVMAGAGLTIGKQLSFRIFRDPTDGQDTYGADAFIKNFGFHYEVDTMGSREINTK